MNNSLTCWAVTEGHAGMQNQCIGLAEALGLTATVKHTKPRAPWKFLPPNWWPNALDMVASDTPFTAPWPDVVISCGRRSVAAALAVKKMSGNRTFAIHIQDPHVPATRFDMLVVPEHDKLRAENVIVVRGAMHHVTREKLALAAPAFTPLIQQLPHPLIGVLVGGSNKRQEFTSKRMREFARGLAAAAKESGGSLFVTPSRRTGADNETILREELKNTPSYIWDGTGANPYFGLLGLSDVIVATSDSVSMVTEACATGRAVYVYDIPGGSARLHAFNQQLQHDGFTQAFHGTVAMKSAPVLQETSRAAALIRPRLDAYISAR